MGHSERRSVCIIAEVQRVIAHGHPHQLIASVDVAVGLFVADPLGTDAAGVVLHLPVPHIQLHSGNSGAAHVAIGVGDEAAVLRSVAFCRHLHPQGVGGGIAAGQVLKIVGARSTAQPLIAQVRAFRLHDEGSGIGLPWVAWSTGTRHRPQGEACGVDSSAPSGRMFQRVKVPNPPDSGKDIAGFVQKNKEAFHKVLRDLTLILKGWGLIDGKLVAIDGTKIRAQNSKHNCITLSGLEKKIAYAEEQIEI